MSSVDKNLSDRSQVNIEKIENAKIGIVTAQWNKDITFALRDGCIETLHDYGVASNDITQIIVPGAFELPTGAKMLLSKKNFDAIICIGCVIKGETQHDEYINNSVAMGIMTLSVSSGKPVIFGVLTPNNKQQALDRAGGIHGNKGVEAALTALQMIQLGRDLKSLDKKSIGF